MYWALFVMFCELMIFKEGYMEKNGIFQTRIFKFGGQLAIEVGKLCKIQNFSSISVNLCLCRKKKNTGSWVVNTTIVVLVLTSSKCASKTIVSVSKQPMKKCFLGSRGGPYWEYRQLINFNYCRRPG